MKTLTHRKSLAGAGVLASTLALAITAAPALAASNCPPGSNDPEYCQSSGQAQNQLQQQQQTAANTQQLNSKVTNAQVAAAINAVLNLSDSVAVEAKSLANQAAAALKAGNTALANSLSRASEAAAQTSDALAQAAQATAVVVLNVQSKAVQHQVQNQLGLSKFYAAKAQALLRQAQAILNGGAHARSANSAAHVTPAQQAQANKLIAQARGNAAKSTAAALKAQELVGSNGNPSGPVGSINKSLKTILVGYLSIVGQTKGLESRVKSAVARHAIDAFLARAKQQADAAAVLQGTAVVHALAKIDLASALGQISNARVKAAHARSFAAEARGLAVHAVSAHE